MTPQDELEAKGRIVTDYAAAKSRLATLQNQASIVIGKLQALAAQINNYETAPVNYELSFIKNTDFQALMNDLQATSREKARLEGQLAQLGIDIRR